MARMRTGGGMRMRAELAMLAALAFAGPLTQTAAQPAAPVEHLGSLYPETPQQTDASALAEALGPARYILNDIGPSEEFRAEIRRAIGLHPVLHEEASRRDEARGAIHMEQSALYPRLSASLTGDYTLTRRFAPSTQNVVESLRPDGQVNAGLSVSQLVFDGGATFERIKGARAHSREQQQTLNARINELALSALSAYHDLATHQAILKLGDEFIARHEKLLADVKERARLGGGSRADVMQAAARLAAARARVSQIRESMRLAEIRYEEFFKTEPALLARPSFDAVAVGSRQEAAALAMQHNPDVAAAAARVDQAKAAFKAERASRLPEVRATVSAAKFDVFAGGNDYDLRAGVNLNYDLYRGGARGMAIKRARERARQQKFDEERVRQETGRDAEIAYEKRQSADERVAALADALIANYAARDLIAERFRLARGDLIDVLQAENDYFEAGVAYLAGLADRDMATYALMEHTGDLLRFFSPQPEYAEAAAAHD